MTTDVICLDDDRWDMLVASSPQGSPFNRREFLDALGTRSIRLGVLEGETVLSAIAIQLGRDDMPLFPPDTMGFYQGILLSPLFESMPEHSRVRKELEAVDRLLSGVTSRYGDLWLGLHWRFRDLRSLQWFNYHTPDLGTFQTFLRYTGIIDLSAFKSEHLYLNSMATLRRRNYRKALDSGVKVSVCNDVDILDHLHDLTFRSQGMARGCLERQLKPISRAAIAHGFGEILVASTPDGNPVSASLFVWDDDATHYLFGANDPTYRGSGAGTLVMVENLARAMRRGNRHADVVGINSPQRGNFKTSFNATPVPYFEARWHRP